MPPLSEKKRSRLISRRTVFAIILIVLVGAGGASYFVYANYIYQPSPKLTCSEGTVVTGDTNYGSMAYDSANGLIYIGVGSNLTVVNASTNAIIEQIPVGFPAITVGFDPANNLVYIGGDGLFRNSVLNPASGRLTSLSYNASLPYGASSFVPKMDVFYTPEAFYFAEVNATSDRLMNLTFLNNSQSIWDTAYDKTTGLVYLADHAGNYLLAVNPASNEIVDNTSLAYGSGPSSLVVDPTNGYLYVADFGNLNHGESGNVSIINPKTNALVKTIHDVGPLPNFVVYVQSTHDVYFSVAQTGHIVNQTAYATPAKVLGIDSKTDSIVYNDTLSTNATTIYFPTGMIYDPVNSCLYVAGQKGVMAVPTTGS